MAEVDDRADLLYGASAIAAYLSLSVKAARGRIEAGIIPVFKIGGTLCARRSTLTAWLAEQEAKAAHHPRERQGADE